MIKKNLFKIILVLGILLLTIIPCWILKIPLGFNPPSYTIFIVLLIYIAILFYFKNFIDKTSNEFNKKIPNLAVFAAVAIFILGLISTPLFTNHKQKSITSYQTIKINDIFKKDTNKFIMVDSDYAKKLGDKILGSEQLGNFFQVGEYQDIMYNNNFVSVAPLEYNSFIISLNKRTSPGYIIVDKYSGDVKLIDNKKIKYTQDGYILRNVKRKFALHGVYDHYNSRFEIDDNGTPYYISNDYTTKQFLSVVTPNNVVTLNAETGEVKKYKIGEQPKWIDNVYHPDYLRESIEWNMKYVKGYWNTIFGKNDIMLLSQGDAKNTPHFLNYRYIEIDGTIYLYSGVTSSGSDESLTGFMLTNIKTQENMFIKQGAISEIAAMETLMGEAQNYKYYSTFPTLTLVDNKLTYYTTLKDNTNLIKSYGFVDTLNLNKVSFEKSTSLAYLKYSGKSLNTEKGSLLKTKTVKIKRIDYNSSDNNFYIVIDKTIIKVSATISSELINTRDGDRIKIEIDDKNNVYKFDNLEF
ncbi:hypothetical protein OKW23_000329 [Bacilli bacterium PM5-9]|nr:hypothetical protein [Bacilli bacterium PM5-9]